ncbi:MAG TPA: hypothetical protein VH062_02565 [Polyangiaceae bacterium]|jgi:hypothetical protein|nr:hypothetical protein [Polyangiaceae bacterium]
MTASMRSLVFASVLVLAPFAEGCVSDHGVLGEPGAGGSGNDGGSGGTRATHDAATEPVPDAAAAPPAQVDTGTPPVGTRSLTFVNGVTDSPWAAFCLSVVHDGKTTLLASPFPAGGLAYGHSTLLADDTLLDLAADGLAPSLVLASSPDVVKGLDCAHIFALAVVLAAPPSPPDAGPLDAGAHREAGSSVSSHDAAIDAVISDAATGMDASDDASSEASVPVPPVPIAAVRVAALPVVPAGALSEARGYLLVAGGCAGGAGVTDPSEKSVCGELYTPGTPTLSEFVVAPRATAPTGNVGLSVLGGTPALTQVDLGLVPALNGDLITVATRVAPGALRPLASYTGTTESTVGAKNPDAQVELFAFGSDVPIYKQGWAPTLDAGGIANLVNGSSYTLIVIGPFPGFAKRNWWNDPLVTVVENR